MIALDWVEYKYYNDRDIEEPLIAKFVSREPGTVLDVGAHWSGYTYAPQVRELIGDNHYYAIDILQPDEETPKVVDKYIVRNVLEATLPRFDLVLCISAIEHAGITTYQETDYKNEQNKVFDKCLELTEQRFLLTHPYGLDDLYPGQYANITPEMLSSWIERANEEGFNAYTRFFYNKFCQGKEKWYQVDKAFADQVPMDKALGIQCVAATEFTR